MENKRADYWWLLEVGVGVGEIGEKGIYLLNRKKI